jgi:hypothetical protein
MRLPHHHLSRKYSYRKGDPEHRVANDYLPTKKSPERKRRILPAAGSYQVRRSARRITKSREIPPNHDLARLRRAGKPKREPIPVSSEKSCTEIAGRCHVTNIKQTKKSLCDK